MPVKAPTTWGLGLLFSCLSLIEDVASSSFDQKVLVKIVKAVVDGHVLHTLQNDP